MMCPLSLFRLRFSETLMSPASESAARRLQASKLIRDSTLMVTPQNGCANAQEHQYVHLSAFIEADLQNA